jgi:hypothetical protein
MCVSKLVHSSAADDGDFGVAPHTYKKFFARQGVVVLTVHGMPTCRQLDHNELRGTLPKEWSTWTGLTTL